MKLRLKDEYRPSSVMRVAIASYDARILRICYSCLMSEAGVFVCDRYQEGQALLAALESGVPYHALVLDNAFSDMPGPELRRRLLALELPDKPRLFLLDAPGAKSGASVNPLSAHGFCITSSCDLRTLLLDLQLLHRSLLPADTMLDSLLTMWGLPPGGASRSYLWDAVQLMLCADGPLAIRKDVLRQVGEQNNVSIAAVDSALRRLVGALDKTDKPAWRAFKAQSLPAGGKFTTGKFLYAIKAELLRPADRAAPAQTEGAIPSDEQEPQPV